MPKPIRLQCVVTTIFILPMLLLAPAIAIADGNSPLSLPDRGTGPSGVQGESTTSATPSPSVTPTSAVEETGNEVSSGTVRSIVDGRIIVEVNGEEHEIDLPDEVRVLRDGQEAQLSEIAAGDEASFERNENGQITEVRVASQQSMNFWRGFLPILVVVLVGFYLLSRRTKRNSA